MSDAMMWAAAGGATGAVACMLLALRVKSSRRAFVRAFAAWSKAPVHYAVAVVSAWAGGAALCLLPARAPEAVTALAQHTEQGAQPKAYDLLAVAPGSGSETQQDTPVTDGAAGDRRDKAIESLRNFASRIESKREMIASLGQEQGAPETTGGLPDVDTMMDRLRERLKSQPDDVKGWMTLGWAYANTGKYAEASTAYETALKLDSGNEEIKSALADARGKATAATAAAAPASPAP